MKLFKCKPKFRNPARYYTPCHGWGNSIEVTFDDTKEGHVSTTARVVGWQPFRPVDGDVYLMPMQSGKTAVWVFYEIKHYPDPHDMFSGKLMFMGYEDVLKMPTKVENRGVHLL